MVTVCLIQVTIQKLRSSHGGCLVDSSKAFGASGDEQSASTLKNAFFTLQADYSKDTQSTYDVDHRDNLFNYGYIGKFTPVRELVENTPLDGKEKIIQ